MGVESARKVRGRALKVRGNFEGMWAWKVRGMWAWKVRVWCEQKEKAG